MLARFLGVELLSEDSAFKILTRGSVFLKACRNGHFPQQCMKMTISTYLCQH